MVKNLFSLLYSRQTSILSAASIIMATLLLSKILGLIRDRLLAHVFPPDTVAIFFAAFQWPDLIFTVFIFGALSVAFIPIFTEHMENKGKEDAFKLAQSVLNLALIVLIIAAVMVYLFIDPLTSLVASSSTSEQKMQVANLTKIILIGQIILSIGALFTGVLQSFQRFIIPALAPVFYNLGIIIGILFLSKPYGIAGPAIGVLIGAVLHIAVQFPLIKSLGFKLHKPFFSLHPGVKEIVALMSVRAFGLAAEKINEVVVFSLATSISLASGTYLTFAQHLQVVPIGLFGATLAQAALPVLSYERARGRIEEFKITLLTTLHQILFLALPATAILIVLRIPVVRLIFGASQFDWEATVLTGATLAYFSIGLAAQAISLLLIRGFYALKDTRTPVIVSLIVVSLNILLSIYFIFFLKLDVWSLGLAGSIATILSGVLLFWTLHYKVGKFTIRHVLGPFLKMLMATIIMGVALYVPIKLLDQVIFDTTKTINLIILTGISAFFALSVYLILVWFLKVRELDTYVELFKRFGKFQTKLKSKEILPETV